MPIQNCITNGMNGMKGKIMTTTLTGFHHLALRAADFDATVRFYTEGIGCTVKITWGEGDSRAVMLDCGNGNYIEVFAGGTAEPKPEGAVLHFALRSDDVDAAVARAVAAGAVVTMDATDLTIDSQPMPVPVRIAFVKAPDGEIVEFFSNSLT